MQLAVIPPLRPALDLALAHSRSGGVVCYPTDTLYGLGGDATDPAVAARILALKGREERKPFSVLFSDLAQARRYVKLTPGQARALERLLPGPYTVLAPLAHPLPVTPGPLLGVRIPDHEFCRAWARDLGKPVITTSANLSGGRPATCAEELEESLLRSVSLLVDGGPCREGAGSTLIDLPHRRIVRAGAGLERAQAWLEGLEG